MVVSKVNKYKYDIIRDSQRKPNTMHVSIYDKITRYFNIFSKYKRIYPENE